MSVLFCIDYSSTIENGAPEFAALRLHRLQRLCGIFGIG